METSEAWLQHVSDNRAFFGNLRLDELSVRVRRCLPGQTLLPRVQRTLESRPIDVRHRFLAHVQRARLVSDGMISQRVRRPPPCAETPVTERSCRHEQRPACGCKASLIEVETVAGGSPCELRADYSTTWHQQSTRYDEPSRAGTSLHRLWATLRALRASRRFARRQATTRGLRPRRRWW